MKPTPPRSPRPQPLAPWLRLLPAALLALGSGGAAAQAALPFSNDTCVSDRNGLNSAIRESRSCASAVASGSYGYGGAGIGNGRDDSIKSGNGSFSTGWQKDGWHNMALAQTGNGGIAGASSDLTTGQLRASMGNTWPVGLPGGVVTIALTRMGDVLTLVNDTGSDQVVSFGFGFDGGFIGQDGQWEYGYVHMGLASNSGLKFAGSGNFLSGSSITTEFYGDGTYQNTFFGGTDADRQLTRFGDPANGLFGGTAAWSFILPPGESDFVFSFALYVLCRTPDASCDFGNTAAASFGTLPQEVSFRSQSGVFLRDVTAPVPEPGSLAMMVLGLAGLGAWRRRRTQGQTAG